MAMLNNQMIEGFLTIKWGFTLWYVTQNPTISNYEGLDDVGHIRNLPNLLSLVSSLDPSLYRFMMVYHGLWWFMMVYDGLWWSVMVYDGLWWFMMVCANVMWFPLHQYVWDWKRAPVSRLHVWSVNEIGDSLDLTLPNINVCFIFPDWLLRVAWNE